MFQRQGAGLVLPDEDFSSIRDLPDSATTLTTDVVPALSLTFGFLPLYTQGIVPPPPTGVRVHMYRVPGICDSGESIQDLL